VLNDESLTWFGLNERRSSLHEETCRAGDSSEVSFPAQLAVYLQQRGGQNETRVALKPSTRWFLTAW
jgi:hypothetical protein